MFDPWLDYLFDFLLHFLLGILFGDLLSILLDDLLGKGFSLVVRSARPDTVMAQVTGEPWSKLKARAVVMPLDAGGPRLTPYSDHVFLLRPDRYVAACMKVDELEPGAAKVAALVAATF